MDEQLIKDVADIKRALLGDRDFGNDGFIKITNDRITELEKFQGRIKKERWIIIGAAATLGFFVKNFIKFFIK